MTFLPVPYPSHLTSHLLPTMTMTISSTISPTPSTPSTTTPSTMTTVPNTPASPMLASYTPGQIEFIKFLHANRAALTVYDTCTVSRKELVDLLSKSVYVAVPAWISTTPVRRAGRGNYQIPELNVDPATLTVNTNTRGRRPGSPNRKGRGPAPAPAPASGAVAPTTPNS